MHTTPMDLRRLRHMVVLAQRLNFVRASEELGLSQSALTRSVQALERELGLRVFDRDRGGVNLTLQGRIFVERAKALLADAEDLRKAMERAADADAGEVAFGIEPLPARVLLADVLSRTLERSPRLLNRVVIQSTETLQGLLAAGDIEFFVCARPHIAYKPPIKEDRLGSFPLSLLVRAGHPLMREDAPTTSFPVLVAGDAGSFDFIPEPLRPLVAGPRHIIEDFEAITKLTMRTDAVLVASTLVVSDEMADGRIVEINRAGTDRLPALPIVLRSHERRSLSPGAARLRSALQRRMQRLTAPDAQPVRP